MIKLNIQIFGGRGMNYSLRKDTPIRNIDNTKLTMPKGTEIKNVIVIAGAGSKRKIDVIDKVVKKYNGNPKNWSKRVATAKINGKLAEVHYYQNKKDRIGRVEYKIKRWKQ